MRASEPAHALSVTLPKLANWLITVSYPFPVKCMVVVYVWCASMSCTIVVLYTATPKRRGTHRPYWGTQLCRKHSIPHIKFLKNPSYRASSAQYRAQWHSDCNIVAYLVC